MIATSIYFFLCLSLSLPRVYGMAISQRTPLVPPIEKRDAYLNSNQPGQVCIIHSYTGAFTEGHVGWAYNLVGSDSWVYGSTEDAKGLATVAAGDPRTTYSWDAVGTFEELTSTFKNKLVLDNEVYHTADYYADYRCASTKQALMADAWETVLTMEYSGYNVLVDNCLTKLVDILNSYDPGLGLPWSQADSPTLYFEYTLDFHGFGDIENL